MPTEFKIPELGESITAGDVVKVLVKAGDTVEKDQPVLELETDKATIEVPSSVSGTVQDIKVKAGDKVKVGQVVFTVGDGADAPAAAPGKAQEKGAAEKPRAEKGSRTEKPAAVADDKAGSAKPKAQPEGAAQVGGMSQAATPEKTDEDEDAEPAAEREPEAAAERNKEAAAERNKEAAAERSKESPSQKKPRGEVVDISRGARAAQAPPPPDADSPKQPAAPAAPSVRRLARELGVEIGSVPGSGTDGRISIDDVQSYVRAALAGMSEGGGSRGPAHAAPLPDFSKWGEVERKPMSNIRRKTAEHLGHAWNVIPHVTQHDRADITAVEGLRKRYAPQAEKAGGKLTMTAIALKIVGVALQRFPQFNSSLDPERNEVVYKKSIHVGVAADTPRGLLVPVIRDVDRKGIFDLSKDLAQASDKARNGKLALDDMQGGGFTITNLGGIGGTSFTPIVNWPEVAILGVSRSTWEPVWRPASVEDEGSFEPRLILPLSLSYDHRVIDGADAARFLRWVCDAFEQPFVLSL
jgi:pyruvate dehydrogenase E2 component (dihydrolipoamide acetyltransferase)